MTLDDARATWKFYRDARPLKTDLEVFDAQILRAIESGGSRTALSFPWRVQKIDFGNYRVNTVEHYRAAGFDVTPLDDRRMICLVGGWV